MTLLIAALKINAIWLMLFQCFRAVLPPRIYADYCLRDIAMIKPIVLTEDGCDRATAYHMSNKIVRRDDGVFITWLDSSYKNIVARVEPDTGEVTARKYVGQGFDNHCGAAMTMSSDGRLHIVCGSHHTGLLYRAGDDPADPHSWGIPEATGSTATYPSMVCDLEDNLHLAHRTKGKGAHDLWGVCYLKRTANSPWGYSFLLTQAPAPLYSYPTNCLTVGPDGTLHVVIEWYKTWPNNAEPPRTMAVSHLQTRDGMQWFHTDGRPVSILPVQLEDTSPVVFRGGANMRPGNIAILPDGRPCFGIWDAGDSTLELAVRNADNNWNIIDVGGMLGAEETKKFAGVAQVSPTPGGDIILAIACSPDGKWGGLKNEICVMKLNPDRPEILHSETIEKIEPDEPDWLPSIEKFPPGVYRESPWLIWQSGRRGEGCINKARAKVKLARLDL